MESSSGCRRVLKVCLAVLASLASAAKVVISVYAWFGDPGDVGLTLSIPSALAEYDLPISPAEWVHLLWLLLFVWEGLWLGWAWLLICRPRYPQTVVIWFYPTFVLACLLHTGCVFALGRQQLELTFVLVTVLTLVLMVGVALLVGHLYYIRGALKDFYPTTFWLTRIIVLNGIVAYATFSFVSTLFALGAVLSAHANISDQTTSTIVLSLLSSFTVTYFLLEVSILDRFLRHVFTVYPVVLWVLAGVLARVWGLEDQQTNQRNQLFALVLACVAGTLVLVRAVVWCVFADARPLPDYEREEPEYLPRPLPI